MQLCPRRVLVTGGHGLVGTALQGVINTEPVGSRFGKKPGEEWRFIGTADGDLRDIEQAARIFSDYKPTHVIHLAAVVGGLFANMKHKATFFRDNLLINDAVLHSCHSFQITKAISCLSTCVFPHEVTYPLDESKIHLGPPHESNFGYAYAKRMVDIMNRAYKAEYEDNFTSAIPTNVFGPNDNFDLEASHVIPALIRKCYEAKKNKTAFVVGGTGKPLRQFIYSHDLAKLLIWMLREYNDVEPLVLSVGEEAEVSIESIADAIVKAIGFEGEYTYDSTCPDGQYRKPASNAKLCRLLKETGYEFEFTPFEEGLRETISWFMLNYEQARKG